MSATFHLDLSAVSRGRGQSAVARAAYNSREKLYDPFLDKWFNYSKKKYSEKKEELVWSEIITPPGIPTISRQELWQLAEDSEKRKGCRDCKTDYCRPTQIALKRGAKRAGQAILPRTYRRVSSCCWTWIFMTLKKRREKENPSRSYYVHFETYT